MSKLKLLAGALILAAGAPLAAHPHSANEDRGIGFRIDRFEDRLERQISSGRLSPADAAGLREEVRALRRLHDQYAGDGLSDMERDDIHRRIGTLQQRLYSVPQTRPGRYDDRNDRGRGRWDDDRRWDENDRRWRDRNRWEDRGRMDDRRRRWEDRMDDRRRWNDRVDERRSRDRWEDRGRWQDRSNDPYALPAYLRDRFRDTDQYYWRYRGGYVFQTNRATGQTMNSIYVGR